MRRCTEPLGTDGNSGVDPQATSSSTYPTIDSRWAEPSSPSTRACAASVTKSIKSNPEDLHAYVYQFKKQEDQKIFYFLHLSFSHVVPQNLVNKVFAESFKRVIFIFILQRPKCKIANNPCLLNELFYWHLWPYFSESHRITD